MRVLPAERGHADGTQVPWSLQWRRDSRQAAPLGQGHGWSRGRYSLVDVSRFMPLRWARLDDSTGSSRGARGVLFRAK